MRFQPGQVTEISIADESSGAADEPSQRFHDHGEGTEKSPGPCAG